MRPDTTNGPSSTNRRSSTNRLAADAASLALQALVWVLGEEDRAQRLLDVTGLDPSDLRARAAEPAVLAAVLGFLENYEPDLLECADALEVKPEALVAARERLEA